MSTNKQALRIPRREKHNWDQAVMHTCDFCGQYAMTITRENGEHSCASCCDAEYATVLTCALEMAIDRAEAADKYAKERDAENEDLMLTVGRLRVEKEAAEKRIAELTTADGNLIAWESTTPVYIKFITDERYRRLRPGYQKWYKPYRCSNCAAGISVKGE